jgi:DNA-binding response OmpR family regulator
MLPTQESAMKVLLVDDDVAIQKLVRVLLEQRQHEVFTSDTPYGVSAAILRHAPDVAILDVRMPGLSGPQLAQLIADLPRGQRPVLALWSALDDDSLRDLGLETGLPCISKARGVYHIADAIEALGRGERVRSATPVGNNPRRSGK